MHGLLINKGKEVNNLYISLETGSLIILHKTLESDYLQGRFGAVHNISGSDFRSQFTIEQLKIIEHKKLAKELRLLADRIEKAEVKKSTI